MKNNFKSNWLSTLRKGTLSVGLLLAGSMAMAGQPLNGTYTINAAAATSGTNFRSFKELVDTLDVYGVSGAVTINVVSGSGPYTERVVFSEVAKTSKTNSITINGNGEKVLNTSSSSVFEFDGADYITLNNLKIEAQGTSTGTRCIHFWKGADYNTIENCELIISKYTGTSHSTAYVAFTGSKTSGRSTGRHGDNNVIHNNTMHNDGNSGVGPYFGIDDYRSTGTRGDGNNVFSNNNIRDVYFYSVYLYYAQDNQVVNNVIQRSRSGTNTFYGIYYFAGTTNTGQIKLNNNQIHNASPNNLIYGIYLNRCSGGAKKIEVIDNEIYNLETRTVYGIRLNGSSDFIAKNNDIHDNVTSGNVIGFDCQSTTNGSTTQNTIHDNEADGTFYGFFSYYGSGDITNNLIYNNEAGSSLWGFAGGYQTSGNLNIAHNTFVASSDVSRTIYGIYQYHWNPLASATISFRNNLIMITAEAGSGVYPVYTQSYTDDMDWEGNNFYTNTRSNVIFRTQSSGYSTVAAFNNHVNDQSNIAVDPLLTDLKAGILKPTNPAMANLGVPGYAKIDYDGNTRTACGPDIGAYEFFVDHSASDLLFKGKNECGGYSEQITFNFNNGTKVDLEGGRVYYAINDGQPMVEVVDKIGARTSTTYTFESIPEFHHPGTNTLKVGLVCDDNAANNVLTTTLDITPAPHSFDLVEASKFKGYFRVGTMSNPDVTVSGYQIDYVVQNPAKYPNTRYGTTADWSMEIVAYTETGRSLTNGFVLTAPTSAANGKVSYDPTTNFCDSLVFVGLRVTDHITGCDSVLGRWVYVACTPQVSWTPPTGCDGDILSFVNGTSQKVGAVEYHWDFGNPASANNTSTISDPVHRFTSFGTYNVTLSAWNFDYPKFVYSQMIPVTVSPVPSVDFSVENACEGSDLQFRNYTTLPSGISGIVDYRWNFDDGATSVFVNPSHQYTNPGGYEVKLTASLNGCESTIVKNANQFALPIADFEVVGSCNLEEVKFRNLSTISIGNSGYQWNFRDGSISNLEHPSHAFEHPGSHTVRLRAISEFGCTSQYDKTFVLNESPKADFSFTDACSETAVEFTREGSLPTGTNSIFEWDFDGEKVSTKENDSHLFNSVGVKKVSLKVSSDNGCSDMIEKEFVVKLQAKADFIGNEVCEGEEVVFTNKSEVASGNLEYLWKFGGVDHNGVITSAIVSPRHQYVLENPGETESFQVTLVAMVPGGCADSIAKTVTVHAATDASFTAQSNWRYVTVIPTVNNPSLTYNWYFGDGGRSSEVSPTYKYHNLDQGRLKVCLSIINNAGCLSQHCEMVDVSVLGVEETMPDKGYSVYPNPNNGRFKVKVDNPVSVVNMNIVDATGKKIGSIEGSGVHEYEVELSHLPTGIYQLQINTNSGVVSKQLAVVK
ncbi:MAG: PKD domain-containing protein [Bacteroidia bacterium]|nr:PKD domain-containing protein [Bacteroidia bacterium]